MHPLVTVTNHKS